MQSFKQYLEEKNWMVAGALTGALLGGGMAYLKNKQKDIPTAETKQSEKLVVTPRASNAKQAKTVVTQTIEKEPEVVKTKYTPSHPLIGNLLDAFSQAEHRGTGTVDYRAFNPKHAIRTKAGGGKSSAWGVFQITGSTAKDFIARKPHLFDDETKEYAQKFSKVGSNMLKADKNHPELGLGKPTVLANPDEHHLYLKMSDGILRGMMDDMKINWKDGMNDQELVKITKRFRGEDEQKYLDIVKNHLQKKR
jgi:hypothetical protein